ncbi:uncharacterized protein LOC144160098 [Haemaphysalis longicornis]
MKVEDLPHQLRVAGDNALVAVPGRPPMCLRCRGTGQVRRECRVPRCETCRHFGHDADACVKTYASVTGPAVVDEASEHLMDEADAEEAARAREEEPGAAAIDVKDDAKGEKGSDKGEDEAKGDGGRTTTPELQLGAKEQPEGKQSGEPQIVEVLSATPTQRAGPTSDGSQPPVSDDLQGTPQDEADAEMADANGASGKRVRDDDDDDDDDDHDEGSGNTKPFCLKILTNNRINGFKLHSIEVKILAYADDIAVFCTEQDSINEAVKDVTAFCKLSGSTINWNKCSGFWHGQWETTPPVYENVQWTVVPTRYLGVPLEYYRDPSEHWKEQTEQAREKTSKWGGRDMSVFTRATVCNLFIVAKVWYVLQVLCMARGAVQRLHRVFAVFLWGSTWERTSRTNLFRSVKNGGVGLAHLFLRQVVARYIFLRDQNNLFLRTVVQVFLRDELSDFVVSSSDVTHNRVRGYLREVVDSFKFLKARFSVEYLGSVSRKHLYKDLLDVCLPEPLYRSLYRGEGGRDVLKRVKRMPVRPSVKSFFFQLHTGTLPVKPWLQEKGLFVAWSINCRICLKPETIDHIFLDCSDSVFHWDILKRTLKKDLVITPHGIRFLSIQSSGGVPYDMFVLLSLHSIWKTRMADRHAHVDAQPARVYFKESMVYMREIYRLQKEPPEWLPLLDSLVALKEF